MGFKAFYKGQPYHGSILMNGNFLTKEGDYLFNITPQTYGIAGKGRQISWKQSQYSQKTVSSPHLCISALATSLIGYVDDFEALI